MSRILIVEDEMHLADGIRFNLEAEGHEVDIEGNGQQALDTLGGVAEGPSTTIAARELGQRLGVEMPITEVSYQVLYQGLDPRTAITALMSCGICVNGAAAFTG